MDLRQLLVHELGPLPWLLALFDGALVKTKKAALPKRLEDGIENLQHLPTQTTAVIIDVMVMIQPLGKTPEILYRIILESLTAENYSKNK